MKTIILVLGSPNDDLGNLSEIALDRLNCVIDLYDKDKEIKILCTGGFGKQFNRTNIPHATYAHSYLISKGVNKKDFLPDVHSSNTVDDFRMAKEVITKEEPEMLIIVTSDFHIKRAKLLHNLLMNYPFTIFVSAKSSLSQKELEPLILHEKKAIQALEDNNYIIY